MTSPAVPILAARQAGRVFGAGDLAVRALHPTNLDVQRGEVLMIMGPSGSGKTTLLSILGLLLDPSEGEVWLHGQPLRDRDPERLTRLRRAHVGFVFQSVNLLASLTALENVTLPLRLTRIAARERDVRGRALLCAVGLAGKEQAKPRQLSGGQQQRVAIARALVTGASALLCDEPTASLDVVSGRTVLGLLRHAATRLDRAVVIVTHDERVLEYADRVVEIADGAAGPLRRLAEKGVMHAS